MSGNWTSRAWGLVVGVFLVLMIVNFAGAIGPDARSLGMGGAGTAIADGASAIYWNPANLALNSGRISLLVGTGVEVSNSTLTFGDIQRLVSGADINVFRSQLETNGLNMDSQMVGGLGLSFGSLGMAGLPLGSANGVTDPGFWKVLFILMNGEIPPAGTYTGAGNISYSLVNAYTLSYARKISLPGIPLAVGISGKWLSGMSYGDITGEFNFTPPVADPAQNYTVTKEATNGTGMAVDLGLGMKLSSLIQVGLVFENLTGSMQWNGTTTREEITGFDGSGNPIISETVVPETYQTTLPPVTRLGIAFRPPIIGLILAGDVRMASGRTTYNLGLEWPLWFLALRAGYASDPTAGTGMFSAGLGLNLLTFHLDFAVASPTITDYNSAKAAKFALSGGFRF